MDPQETQNGWSQYKKLIIHELQGTERQLDRILRRLGKLEQKLTVVQTKIYVAASVAAAVFTGLVQLVMFVLGKT
jgi:hypothetical protein